MTDDFFSLDMPTPILGMPSTENQQMGMHLLMAGKVTKISETIYKVGSLKPGDPDHVVNLEQDSCSNCKTWAHAKPRKGYNCAEKWGVYYKRCFPVINGALVDDWRKRYDADEVETIAGVPRLLPTTFIGTEYKGKKTRGGYSRHQKHYGDALRSEFTAYVTLARLLTQDIHWPDPQPGDELRGRRAYPLGMMIFAGLIKVRFQWSYRMVEGFLEFLQAVGWLVPPRMQDRSYADGRPREKFYPDFAAIKDFFNEPTTTPHLRKFLRDTFMVLSPLSNHDFAMDMSGEGSNRYFDYVRNQRGGKRGSRDANDYLRANVIMDVDTMGYAGAVITRSDVHESKAAEPLIEFLLQAYREGKSASFGLGVPENWRSLGDGGYNAKKLREFVVANGGDPYYPYSVKVNANRQKGLGATLYQKFSGSSRKWNRVYRMRTKVECGFSSIDANFGPSVSTHTFVGQTNEILLKLCGSNVHFIGIAVNCYELDVEVLGQETGLREAA